MNPQALGEWINLGEAAVGAGIRLVGVVQTIKAALQAKGIAADTAALDGVIADAERRLAEAQAEGTHGKR